MASKIETRSTKRTNEEWLRDLRAEGMANEQAIIDLRDYVLRSVLVYLTRHRSDLARYEFSELKQLAEDWAQQGVLQILDNLDSFQGKSRFTTWAYRVAINLAAGELRRKRWANLSLEHLTESDAPDISLREDTTEIEPEHRVARQQVWEAIQQAIAEDLTERQRTALTSVILEGVSPEQVAVQMDTNRNNIYKIVHDARKKLRQALEDRNWSAHDVLTIFGATAGD